MGALWRNKDLMVKHICDPYPVYYRQYVDGLVESKFCITDPYPQSLICSLYQPKEVKYTLTVS